MAAALAVMPGWRKVTGVHRVPSRSPVPRAATAPSATHGSGIGSQALPTCGIWTRWSMRASPANPAASAASAISRSQPIGSSPHGKRDTWRRTSTPVEDVRSGRSAAVGVAAGRSGTAASSSSGSTWRTTSHPSSATSAATARALRSWPARAGAGTGTSRSALRRRHRSSGVSRRTTTAGQPCGTGEAEPPSSAVDVEAEGVDDRRQPSPEARRDDGLEEGEGVGRGVEVVRAAPDDAAQGVRADDLLGAVPLRPRRLPRARGADEHHECRVGERHGGSLPDRVTLVR